MRVYRVNLKPLTPFGTILKGDTLFGHICWQIYYDSSLLGKTLQDLLSDYFINPFLIVSSAFPVVEGKIYLKRPSLPLHYLYPHLSEDELIAKRKELKRKSYFAYSGLIEVHNIDYMELPLRALNPNEQVRCAIHRLKNTTDEPPFSPYVVKNYWYLTKLVIFLGLREDLQIEGVIEALRRVGRWGYGKDASLGWGKFEVLEVEPFDPYEGVSDFNAYYTLSPSLPEKSGHRYRQVFYEPFVRFGRFGDIRSISVNPFKAPILLADESAIYVPDKVERRIYLGRALSGVSQVFEDTVHQAYSLVIPAKL